MSKKSETSLDDYLHTLTMKYGEGTIYRIGDTPIPKVDVIPTGSLALDLALGVGGIPRARITEIYGPDASGKTTLCQHIVANAQKAGGVCAYIDMEHAIDLGYASRCGVDIENLLVSQPSSGELALTITEQLVRSGWVSVIIIDSVAALVPQAELDGDIGSPPIGMQARLMSSTLRKLSGAIMDSNTAVVFTNQLRYKIGVMFGSPETTPGGVALKFYASVRLDIRRIGQIKVGNQVIGARTRVKVVKNKVSPPLRTAEFDIMYGTGISHVGDLLDLGLTFGLVRKTGSFYYLGETRLGQGRDNAKNFLEDNQSITDELETEIRKQAEDANRLDYAVIGETEAE